MVATWYYVEDNERVGPISEEDFVTLIKKKKIVLDSYVWKKGFENWTLLKEVEDYRDLASLQLESNIAQDSINVSSASQSEDDESSLDSKEGILDVNRQSGFDSSESISFEQSSPSVISFDWSSIDKEERIFTIRIGRDRGVKPVEYGPFSFNMIKDLLAQKEQTSLQRDFLLLEWIRIRR